MFSSGIGALLAKLSDVIDDMLLGDYDYVVSDGKLYADVDYQRKRQAATLAPTIARRGPCAANRTAAAETLVGR
jgi:hypothetical protein